MGQSLILSTIVLNDIVYFNEKIKQKHDRRDMSMDIQSYLKGKILMKLDEILYNNSGLPG